MRVGFVVVSHSKPLAEAAVALADIMVSTNRPPLAIAAGLDDGSFGTDVAAIMAAIDEVHSAAGTVVFVDMGSALLSAQTALELGGYENVRILSAPFVEGLTAGLIRAATGGSLTQVIAAAEDSLQGKVEALDEESFAEDQSPSLTEVTSPAREGVYRRKVTLINEVGLHARPAARFAQLSASFDSVVEVSCKDKGPVNAESLMALMGLGARKGDVIVISAVGSDAKSAVEELADFAARGLGD